MQRLPCEIALGDIVRAMIDAEINTHRQDRSDFRMHICRFQMLKDIITFLGSSSRVTRSLSSSSSATGLKWLMGVKDSSTALSPCGRTRFVMHSWGGSWIVGLARCKLLTDRNGDMLRDIAFL